MAKSKSLLQEAVVAAKEVREAAIQHAYKELEENLTPSIKEALAQKLEEEIELEDENLDEAKNAMSGFEPVKEKKAPIKEEDEPEEEEKAEEEVEIKDEEGEDEVEVDAEEETEEEPEESGEMPEAEEEEPEKEESEEPSDDTELKDLTLGDLKELIASMVSAIAPERPAEQPEDMVPADVEGKGEEEVPISGDEEEIDLDITDDETKPEEKDEEGEDVEIDLTELLKELESEEHDRKVVTHKQDAEFQAELDEVKRERDEALKVVNELKETLKETNLLNARLSCVSQLLSKPLTEGQKVRAIRSLDEAQTPKEAKAVYRTLVECFESENKSSKKNGLVLREHRGSASKAVGKSTAAPIVDVDPMVKRFQQLAGIIQ